MDGLPEGVDPSHSEDADPSSIPMSDYNNNPGNIRHSGIDYEGSMGVDPKTNFVIFGTPEHGRRALVGDLAAKQRRGIDTPHKLVEAYLGKDTPENVNSPETKANYKQHIADSLGMKDVHETFPELSSIPLANAVSQFESGRWKKPKSDENSGKAFDGSELTPSTEESRPGETLEYTDPKEITGVKEAQSNALKVMGAIGGAHTAAAGEIAKRVLPLVPNLANRVFGTENQARPSTRPHLQNYLNSQINGNLHMSLADLEKEYNKAIQVTHPGSATVKIRTMSEVQQALDAMKPTTGTRVATKNVRGSTYKTIPGAPGINTSAYTINPNTPLRNDLKSGVTATKNFVSGAIPTAGKLGLGALGGAQALSGGYDTWDRAVDKGKGWMDPRTITKGASTLGGLGLMIPWKPAQVAGALAMAPEAYLSGKDSLSKEEMQDRLDLGLPRSRSYQEVRSNTPAKQRTHSVSGTIKNN